MVEVLDTPEATGLTLPAGPVAPDFRASLETALAGIIPPGKSGALLAVATQDRIVFSTAARLDEHWTVGAEVEKVWGGPVTGRVMVMATW